MIVGWCTENLVEPQMQWQEVKKDEEETPMKSAKKDTDSPIKRPMSGCLMCFQDCNQPCLLIPAHSTPISASMAQTMAEPMQGPPAKKMKFNPLSEEQLGMQLLRGFCQLKVIHNPKDYEWLEDKIIAQAEKCYSAELALNKLKSKIEKADLVVGLHTENLLFIRGKYSEDSKEFKEAKQIMFKATRDFVEMSVIKEEKSRAWSASRIYLMKNPKLWNLYAEAMSFVRS